MELLNEKFYVKKMDSSPRFLVWFVAICAAVIYAVGWGLKLCVDFWDEAYGFWASVLPFFGVAITALLVFAAQALLFVPVKGILEHAEKLADNFKKSYAALLAIVLAGAMSFSLSPMWLLWDYAKGCWEIGGFCYAISCLAFVGASLGLAMAYVGTYLIPIVALAMLANIPEMMRKDEEQDKEVNE